MACVALMLSFAVCVGVVLDAAVFLRLSPSRAPVKHVVPPMDVDGMRRPECGGASPGVLVDPCSPLARDTPRFDWAGGHDAGDSGASPPKRPGRERKQKHSLLRSTPAPAPPSSTTFASRFCALATDKEQEEHIPLSILPTTNPTSCSSSGARHHSPPAHLRPLRLTTLIPPLPRSLVLLVVFSRILTRVFASRLLPSLSGLRLRRP